jgi:hypothetical protein
MKKLQEPLSTKVISQQHFNKLYCKQKKISMTTLSTTSRVKLHFAIKTFNVQNKCLCGKNKKVYIQSKVIFIFNQASISAYSH